MLLEPIYEQDFLDCSYGFRPGRSAHGALESLWKQTMDIRGGWILEVDIRKFFDHLDHGQLCQFLQHRVRDGVLSRLIGKWLKAGVMEKGSVSYPKSGSPQGGVVSPILSNIFLHYVLDVWFEKEVKPRLREPAFLIRFADDFAMGFRNERDAQRVMKVIPKRLEKYGLMTHPDKTRLVSFQSPSPSTGRADENRLGPGTFDLLGFTHYWGRSRKGRWVVQRKTASSRYSRAVRSIAQWCRMNRHRPICYQREKLSQKLHGHYAYYGITGNIRSLTRFYYSVHHCWHKWLNRRNRQHELLWTAFGRLAKRFPLPPPRIVQSYSRSKPMNLRNRML